MGMLPLGFSTQANVIAITSRIEICAEVGSAAQTDLPLPLPVSILAYAYTETLSGVENSNNHRYLYLAYAEWCFKT